MIQIAITDIMVCLTWLIFSSWIIDHVRTVGREFIRMKQGAWFVVAFVVIGVVGLVVIGSGGGVNGLGRGEIVTLCREVMDFSLCVRACVGVTGNRI